MEIAQSGLEIAIRLRVRSCAWAIVSSWVGARTSKGSAKTSDAVSRVLSMPVAAEVRSGRTLTNLSNAARIRCFEALAAKPTDWLVNDMGSTGAARRWMIAAAGGHDALIARFADFLETHQVRQDGSARRLPPTDPRCSLRILGSRSVETLALQQEVTATRSRAIRSRCHESRRSTCDPNVGHSGLDSGVLKATIRCRTAISALRPISREPHDLRCPSSGGRWRPQRSRLRPTGRRQAAGLASKLRLDFDDCGHFQPLRFLSAENRRCLTTDERQGRPVFL